MSRLCHADNLAALHQARSYLAQGLAGYEASLLRHNARIHLANGQLDRAIHNTQVALFLHRLRRVGAQVH